MKARLIAALVALTALASAVALAAPMPAHAHQADSLHQHGWSSLTMLFTPFGQPIACVNTISSYGATGAVRVYYPDVITSPAPIGKLARVYFTARLEQWTGSSWYTIPDNTPWVYALANQSGLQGWYNSSNLLIQAYPPTFGWNVGKGYYRVHLYFYWEYDGTKFYGDTTNWCQVS